MLWEYNNVRKLTVGWKDAGLLYSSGAKTGKYRSRCYTLQQIRDILTVPLHK